MNTNMQIQIHFHLPGEWGEFILTALWTDAEGYDCRRQYGAQELTEEQAAALQGVIRTLVSLGEPWACTHAVAVLSEEGDAVELIVHARRDADGATRSFTPADYPQLRLSDVALTTAFRDLTGASA